MPPWNHIHPAIVHFPIALLTVAPLLVFVGLTGYAGGHMVHDLHTHAGAEPAAN